MFPLAKLRAQGLDCRIHSPVGDYIELRERLAKTKPVVIPLEIDIDLQNNVEIVEFDTDATLIYYQGLLDRIILNGVGFPIQVPPGSIKRGELLLPRWTNGVCLVNETYIQLIELLTGILEIHWTTMGYLVKIVINVFEEDNDE